MLQLLLSRITPYRRVVACSESSTREKTGSEGHFWVREVTRIKTNDLGVLGQIGSEGHFSTTLRETKNIIKFVFP
jgi:hypothetical protein